MNLFFIIKSIIFFEITYFLLLKTLTHSNKKKLSVNYIKLGFHTFSFLTNSWVLYTEGWFNLHTFWLLEGEKYTSFFWNIQISWALRELLHVLLVTKKSKDYTILLSHHITLNVILLIAQYNNYYKVSIIIITLFDISDILLQIAKIAENYYYICTAFFFLIQLIVIWAYTRLYLYFSYILLPLYKLVPTVLKCQTVLSECVSHPFRTWIKGKKDSIILFEYISYTILLSSFLLFNSLWFIYILKKSCRAFNKYFFQIKKQS